mmetsp:Transcript_9574/g.20281  ORF Transcript_9574/g.20281 Transcript_9574/m.20281 type:complete len:231 (-) Transcript_9574:218-910(-)
MSCCCLLLTYPWLRSRTMKGGGVGFPQHCGASTSANSVEGKKDAASIHSAGRITVLGPKPVVPESALLSTWSGRMPHREAVVNEARVCRQLIVWNVFCGKESLVFRPSTCLLDKPGRKHARIVTAFEGVGLATGFRVAVVVFLECSSVFEPVLHLLRRSLLHELLSLLQLVHEVIHVRRDAIHSGQASPPRCFRRHGTRHSRGQIRTELRADGADHERRRDEELQPSQQG